MGNHARIGVVGHKVANWETKLQACEDTSPQGEHGSTRVSWQEQLQVTDLMYKMCNMLLHLQTMWLRSYVRVSQAANC